MRCRAEPSRPSSHPAPRPRPQSRRRPASARVAGLGVTRVRGAQLDALVAAPPPLPRTKWTRHVPHPVLIGHAGAQLDALVAGLGARLGLGSVGVLVLCAVTPPPPPPPLFRSPYTSPYRTKNAPPLGRFLVACTASPSATRSALARGGAAAPPGRRAAPRGGLFVRTSRGGLFVRTSRGGLFVRTSRAAPR